MWFQSVTQSSSVVSVAMLMCVNRLDKAVWMLISKEYEENTKKNRCIFNVIIIIIIIIIIVIIVIRKQFIVNSASRAKRS